MVCVFIMQLLIIACMHVCILCAVSVMIFQTFSCQDVGSHGQEDSYMTADYRVSCDSERYAFAYWWALAMVFVYPLGESCCSAYSV